ncbi:transmembrane protein 97 [Thecamonas trahens ATCC 50062]|uniref:Transmembrane protein 97 n=1 Tax=Thecamonas trahens ATCC 50062 TaxID=461836 RepID=A0A0L0DGW0_THETB|nr:transmembrane protein 97 [Thecamonas trahens ATCC 50062]KNC51450.1 transmembrane protein 97 [Thecamonas trahens ATCC 50062]|eukprot:XP_013756112.1 transmembrane protein 97 [Thecamonas trahens ATCC 50062]
MWWLDAVFLVYFAVHIPTTALIDAQCLPVVAELVPGFAKELLAYHVETFHDPLVADPPRWFVSLVVCEALLQLPFFFVAVYAFVAKRNWIRIPAIIYGAHVATTLVPILAEIAYAEPKADSPGGVLTPELRATLIAIYIPYLLVPITLVVRMACAEHPFGEPGKAKMA